MRDDYTGVGPQNIRMYGGQYEQLLEHAWQGGVPLNP